MRIDTSLAPLPRSRFSPAAARHLLWRAGYAGTPQEVRELHALGLDDAIARLVDFDRTDTSALPSLEVDRDILRNRTREEQQEYRAARDAQDQEVLDRFSREGQAARAKDRKLMAQLQQWWAQRMIDTPRPAEERLTLLWHGHFATSYRSVPDTFLMQQQNQLLRREANGNFATLTRGIVRDPAMLRYLNNNRNNKRRPNENLARELMELFTLGVGNYSENDIKEGARALTGYNVDDNDFRFYQNQHDDEPKTILGQTGPFDGDAFVDILLRQQACAQFTCLKLYDHFVADVGDRYDAVPDAPRRVIDDMARTLMRHEYRIAPVLTELFRSRHFYDDAVVGHKIKDPTQLMVGTVRGLGTPTRQWGALSSGMQAMGQVLFQPPTVNGWDSGRAWINTSTLFARQNLTTYLISGQHPQKKYKAGDVEYRPTRFFAGDVPSDTAPSGGESSGGSASGGSSSGGGASGGATVEAVVDGVMQHLLGQRVSADRRAVAVRFMQDRGGSVTDDSLVALLCLVSSMPEYQLC